MMVVQAEAQRHAICGTGRLAARRALCGAYFASILTPGTSIFTVVC